MPKTVHVIPRAGRWAGTHESGKTARVFTTQREAIERAREMAKRESSGQLVVHGRNGLIREHDTYGMPRIQDPPGKKSAKIVSMLETTTSARGTTAEVGPLLAGHE